MLRVIELAGRQRVDPADENYIPSGFKEYDKCANGFARGTLTVISGWILTDSRNLQLDIVRHAVVSDCRPPSSVLGLRIRQGIDRLLSFADEIDAAIIVISAMAQGGGCA